MKDLNKFIVNAKLNDLIAFCDDSDKVALASLLDKYKFSYVEITDGTRKPCKDCKVVKPLNKFKIHRKGGSETVTDKCYDCYDRECARKTLVNTNIKQLMEMYDDKLDGIKSCNGCELSVIEKGEGYTFSTPNYESKECNRCIDESDRINNEVYEAEQKLRKGLDKVITDDHIEFKVILNKARKRIAEYKKELQL